jgi:hypothetical protein
MKPEPSFDAIMALVANLQQPGFEEPQPCGI